MNDVPQAVTDLYAAHVARKQRTAVAVLEDTGFDALVLHSGTPLRYFADDQDAPFRRTPHFAAWLPLAGPHHLLVIRPDARPLLIRYAPEDYWYEQAPLGDPFYAGPFDLVEVGTEEEVFAALPKTSRAALVIDQESIGRDAGFGADQINPAGVVARLDWERSIKTPFEVACLRVASAMGAQGHIAARTAFEAGNSEMEIHHAYLTAIGCTEQQLPYESIVAHDEKGAILHYTGKRSSRDAKVLLIDVGANFCNYASDITRTWTREGCHPTFAAMVGEFDVLQQDLCAAVRPGLPYPELHHQAHRKIGDFLKRFGILRVGGDEAVERGLTRPFFPHGLGHFLGIQVHDVAGHQKEPAGGSNPPPELHPYLRTTRTIEEGQVFTVEPGIYFIGMLLREHRDGDAAAEFDWKLIDALAPCGGIRIEDNIVVTADGHENLTRQHL